MLNFILNLLNRHTMYWFALWSLRLVIAVAVVLSFFGVLPYTWWHILVNMVMLLVFCWVANLVFAKIAGVSPNYESQYISAEILTLIVGPGDPLQNWKFLLLISVVAMASKYLVVVNKRHLFNPAAFSVVVSALLIQQSASWWVGSIYLLPIVLICGLTLAYKLRWLHLVISFLVTYSVLLFGVSIGQGAGISTALEVLKVTMLNSGIFFFATIMLTEPLTAPAGKNYRIAYGALIAVILIVLQTNFVQIYYNLELSLVIGNLIAFAISPNPKITLKLKEKLYFARNSMALVFTADRALKFAPGQFLQYFLPHQKVDSRGTRRYFSIASSPTENEVMITTKFAEKSSSFKKHLRELNPGQTILAASLDGDFLLPKKASKSLVFIAGGVGIAPFRSMIKYLLDKNHKREITLLYANNDFDEIGFSELFEEAKQKIGLKTVYVLSKKIPDNWSGRKGYIDEKTIREEVPDFINKTFYVSGPDPMVRAMVKLLKSLKIPSSQIHSDFFPGYE